MAHEWPFGLVRGLRSVCFGGEVKIIDAKTGQLKRIEQPTYYPYLADNQTEHLHNISKLKKRGIKCQKHQLLTPLQK